MVHRWAAQSWNSDPRARKWGTGYGHVTKMGNAPEEVRDGEQVGKGPWRLLPAEPGLGGSSPHGSVLDSWNPSPFKPAAPHLQARHWWASGPCQEVEMTHEHPWTGRLESQGGKKIIGAVPWEESQDFSFLLMELFLSAPESIQGPPTDLWA